MWNHKTQYFREKERESRKQGKFCDRIVSASAGVIIFHLEVRFVINKSSMMLAIAVGKSWMV